VTLTASASDNVGVVGVQFKVNGVNISVEDTSNPYSIAWDSAGAGNGSHVLSAVARDAAGNTKTASITITVSNVAPPTTSGSIAAYSFNEATGTTVTDASGNGNGGTLSGATWTTQGRFGNAMSFNGTTSFVSVADAATLDLGSSGTIEAWVKLSSLDRWHGVIAKGSINDDAAHNYALEINNSNRVRCILGNGSAKLQLDSTVTVVAGQFYHLACSWNGATVSLFINGTLNASITQTQTPAGNTAPLFVGQFGGNTDRLSGIIDEVRIYRRGLSASEVMADMNTPVNSNLTPPAAPSQLTLQ
jgi:hypothetical protein